MSNEVSRSHVSTSPEMAEARVAMDDWVAYSQSGVGLIEEERKRQIEQEGYDDSHDDRHCHQEIIHAACCYAIRTQTCLPASMLRESVPKEWPWDVGSWKPVDDPIRNLVKAGALIAAEIDRLQRAKLS